jgi:hypothetical protein
MSGTDDKDNGKGRLSLRPAGRLELGRTVDAGSVRQSFSHGRSKVIQVEVRKKRAPAPADQTTLPVADPAPTGRPITATELAARQRALVEQQREAARRESERREREKISILAAAEEARRKAEEDARREAEAAARRATDEERRRKVVEERRVTEAKARTVTHIRRLSNVNQEPVGARWVERAENIAMDPAGDESDAEAAARPVMQQLHAGIVRSAKQFLPLAIRLDNSPGWQGISAAAKELLENVDCDTGSVHFKLGFIYEAALALASFIEQDNRFQREPDAVGSPLDPEVRRSLGHLVGTAAPWLRGFPTINALDDAAGEFLTKNELLGPSAEVLDAARSIKLISAEDAVRVAVLMGAAERGEFQGKKASTRVVGSTRNLLFAGVRIVAACYFGATASDFATKSDLVKRAGSFISETTRPIEKLLIDLPSDIRFAFATLVEHLKANPLGGGHQNLPLDQPDPAIPMAIGKARDSEGQDIDVDREAGQFILEGDPPPETWRPFIRQINLSGRKNFETTGLLAGLTNLRVLNLRGTRVTNLAPLAGLTNLESIDLVNTRVSDISPLAALTNLRSIDLRGTPVESVAALAALASLESLDLKGTRVRDVAALSHLKHLTVRGLRTSD